ncbi:MAG: YdjY domain-containing protein [Planctomycetota bacterium]
MRFNSLPPLIASAMLVMNVLHIAPANAQYGREDLVKKVEQTFGDPPGMIRLDPKGRVWVDKKNKRVVVDGYIALREGQLEMFACLAGTKEHESVVAVFSKAFVVHAGLLAVGADKGTPVKWQPNYQAPTGSEIQISCLWKDEETKEKKSIDARKWVRKVGTKDKVLDTNFVFAGSSMWKDPDTGKEMYQAESGDFVCVSNFSTATLDVPMKSSDVNSGLMFAAFTDRIPPEGTPIRLVLSVVGNSKTGTKATEKQDASKKPSITTLPDIPGLEGPPSETTPANIKEDK